MDIVVCGGGIAGTMAAIAAGRSGAEVLLCEKGGCLGGTLTSSLVGTILDRPGKKGLLAEFYGRLEHECAVTGAVLHEAEKYLLEQMCSECGVKILYHTDIYGCKTENRYIKEIYAHTFDGYMPFKPKIVIDATGNGAVAAMAGCGYDIGNEFGQTQPMSLIAVITGLDPNDAVPYLGWEGKEKFKGLLNSIGVETSLGFPNISPIGGGLYYLSINHEYGYRFDDAYGLTEATLHARREIFTVINKLRSRGGEVFKNIAVADTPELIGIREGRRIHGLYTVTLDDIIRGRSHPDAVCTVRYWVDIHALTADGNRSYTGDEISCKPYQIPFRAQIPADIDNLILAGRCISGDFYAYASYRVAGNMACTGEAAGIMSAESVSSGIPVKELTYIPNN